MKGVADARESFSSYGRKGHWFRSTEPGPNLPPHSHYRFHPRCGHFRPLVRELK